MKNHQNLKRILTSTIALLGLCSTVCGEYSALWGTNGELWDNNYPADSLSARIADCSHAGYRGGDEPIPFYPIAINVTDAPYYAIPNDGIDDSAAIQAAIDACPNTTGGAVYIPEGTFNISTTLVLSKPNECHLSIFYHTGNRPFRRR